MHPLDLPLSAVRALLDARRVSSSELAEQCIARVHERSSLNAFVGFSPDILREQARRADEALRAGQRLPLLGIPIALKDNIQAMGHGCSACTPALALSMPSRDSEVTRRLRDAGAVIAGMLNMHELAFGITNHNAFSMAAHNPWDPLRIPGGSSGGAGVAVAAGLVPAAIGTDTGGSIRVPSALCGVTGLRPTLGRVPQDGIVPISASRDTAGPLANSVADCALLDRVLSGDASALPEIRLDWLRIGVPRDSFWMDLEPEVREICDAVLAAMSQAGVQLVECSMPGLRETDAQCSLVVACHEFVRDMRSYLAIQGRGVGLEEVVAQVRSGDVRRLLEPLLQEGAVSEGVYLAAMAGRQRLRDIYSDTFAKNALDALIFPTTPRVAARIGEDETVELNGRQVPTFPTFTRNTDPGSVASLPGVSLPAGLASGLPVGIALDGPLGSDRRLLSIAAAIEAALPPVPRCARAD
ncbi:indoleacetamide hydrolase [Thiomonas sp. FB-6]|uniref:indoleacetamide hydrolase n=1 Tax=Thiomonas sp. FB-6 TaxID=1158291 RepID=UPI00039C7B47|nr:indoleacetamide hydrolase [Thiomonas sp. FB-6]